MDTSNLFNIHDPIEFNSDFIYDTPEKLPHGYIIKNNFLFGPNIANSIKNLKTEFNEDILDNLGGPLISRINPNSIQISEDYTVCYEQRSKSDQNDDWIFVYRILGPGVSWIGVNSNNILSDCPWEEIVYSSADASSEIPCFLETCPPVLPEDYNCVKQVIGGYCIFGPNMNAENVELDFENQEMNITVDNTNLKNVKFSNSPRLVMHFNYATNFEDIISIRIAIGSATAFIIAQNLDVNIFDLLRKKTWYVAQLTSSILGSIIHTFLKI